MPLLHSLGPPYIARDQSEPMTDQSRYVMHGARSGYCKRGGGSFLIPHPSRFSDDARISKLTHMASVPQVQEGRVLPSVGGLFAVK